MLTLGNIRFIDLKISDNLHRLISFIYLIYTIIFSTLSEVVLHYWSNIVRLGSGSVFSQSH